MNAKRIHDLIQVGENQRFTDQIEYLIEGLEPHFDSNHRLDNIDCIEESLIDIVKRTVNGEGGINSFGMKLKSLGYLGRIYDAFVDKSGNCLLDRVERGQKCSLSLILLTCICLCDVRRIDFFIPHSVAIHLINYVFNESQTDLILEKAKISTFLFQSLARSPPFKTFLLTDNVMEIKLYSGLWMIGKYCGLNSRLEEWLSCNEALISRLISIIKAGSSKEQIFEKSAQILDFIVINSKDLCCGLNIGLLADLVGLVDALISSPKLPIVKLVVSLSASELGINGLVETEFSILTQLLQIYDGERIKSEISIFILSAIVNLVDRCDDNTIENLRYQNFPPSKHSFLIYLVSLFKASLRFHDSQVSKSIKSLLAVIVIFVLRTNKTNFEVVRSILADDKEILVELMERFVESVCIDVARIRALVEFVKNQ